MSTVLIKNMPGSAKPRILILPDNNSAPIPKFVGLEFDQADPEVPVLQADTTGSTGAYIRLAYEYEGDTYAYDEWQENDGEKLLTVSLTGLLGGEGSPGNAVALLVQVSNNQSDVYAHHRALVANASINLPYDSDIPFNFPLALAVASVGCATNEWGIAGAVFGGENLNATTGLLSFANSAEAQGGGMVWRKCAETGNIGQIVLLGTAVSNARISDANFIEQIVQGTSDNWLNFESRIQYAPDDTFEWADSVEGWQPNDSSLEASFDGFVVSIQNGGYLRMQVRETLTDNQYLCGEDTKLIPDPQVSVLDVGADWKFSFSLVVPTDPTNPAYQETQFLPSIRIIGGAYAGDYNLPPMAISGEPSIADLPAGLQAYIDIEELGLLFSKDLFSAESADAIVVKASAKFIYEGGIEIVAAQPTQASATP